MFGKAFWLSLLSWCGYFRSCIWQWPQLFLNLCRLLKHLGPHVAALGMKFYTGDQFPSEYHNQIFIPEHGSWNRSNKIGYRVTLVNVDDNRNAAGYEIFAEGWLQGEEAWGRPVALLNMPDGSMLLSDDKAGVIYRIWYER